MIRDRHPFAFHAVCLPQSFTSTFSNSIFSKCLQLFFLLQRKQWILWLWMRWVRKKYHTGQEAALQGEPNRPQVTLRAQSCGITHDSWLLMIWPVFTVFSLLAFMLNSFVYVALHGFGTSNQVSDWFPRQVELQTFSTLPQACQWNCLSLFWVQLKDEHCQV